MPQPLMVEVVPLVVQGHGRVEWTASDHDVPRLWVGRDPTERCAMPVTNLSSPNCAAIEDRRGRFYASSPIVEAVCGVGQSPGRVGADDVRTVVEAAVTALSAAADADWSARAGDLEWDCWERWST